MGILETARNLAEGGLSLIPIAIDGSKSPMLKKWEPFQKRRATERELETWFKTEDAGIGIVAGNISGGLEIIDFDDESVIKPWISDVSKAGQKEFIMSLPMVATPTGGLHIYYRCPSIEGNQKLASKPNEKGRPDTMIETRGEGGYVISPGSPATCHPANQEYKLINLDLTQIPIITEQERAFLLNLSRSFNRYVKPEAVIKEHGNPTGNRPGDLFNARAVWNEILEPFGWISAGQRGETQLWKRPGLTENHISATTNHAGTDLLYVFSTNGYPFDSDRAYTKFSAFTLLNHNGDFKAAAKDLRNKGYFDPSAEAPNYEPEAGEIEALCTDIANRNRFVAMHKKDVFFVSGKKGGKWFLWTGKKYAEDRKLAVNERAIETVQAITGEAAKLPIGRARHVLTRWANNSCNLMPINNMLELSRSALAVEDDIFDADPFLFNLSNCVLNLETGKAVEHSREYRMSKISPVKYDESATCPQWEKFLLWTMCGDKEMVDFLQRLVGYTLTGSTKEQVFMFIDGPPENGKGTFIRVIRSIMGDYSTNADKDLVVLSRYPSKEANPAKIIGARFVSISEFNRNDKFNEGRMNQLTGQDMVSASQLWTDTFDFDPISKLWLVGNHKPEVGGGVSGIFRRMLIIPFVNKLKPGERDDELDAKLKIESSGILNWAKRGTIEWRKSGLCKPKAVTQANKEYRTMMDIPGMFLEECCILDKTASCPCQLVYDCYRSWCQMNGYVPVSQTQFGLDLKAIGITKSPRTNKGYQYFGINLRQGLSF